MELKPTLFSVSGFLAPGVVFVGSVSCLLLGHYYGSLPSVIAAFPALPAEGAAAVLLCALAGAAFLALSFVMGAILSDTFIFIGRRLILRPLTRPALRNEVKRLFAHQTLEELIRADMDARESYVFIQTCGLDLHWYAGRIRMMGGSGLGLLLAAIFASCLGYSWSVFLALLIPSVFGFWVALYRSIKFDEYLAASAAVIKRGGGASPKQAEA